MNWRERKRHEEVSRRIGVESDPVRHAEYVVIIYDRYFKTYSIDSAAASKTEANRDFMAAKRAFPNHTVKIITQKTLRKHFSGYSSTWKLTKRKK